MYVSNDPINNRDPSGKFDWDRVWNRTVRYWKNANSQVAGIAMPGVIALADASLKGKSFSEIDWIAFGFAGAGGAIATSGLTALAVGASFEAGLLIGSAMMAIIDEIWR